MGGGAILMVLTSLLSFLDHYAFLDAKFSRIIVVQVSLGERRSVALSTVLVQSLVGANFAKELMLL